MFIPGYLFTLCIFVCPSKRKYLYFCKLHILLCLSFLSNLRRQINFSVNIFSDRTFGITFWRIFEGTFAGMCTCGSMRTCGMHICGMRTCGMHTCSIRICGMRTCGMPICSRYAYLWYVYLRYAYLW